MKTRKIILIAADVILLFVCILQWIAAAKDNAKTFDFSETPDELVIERPDGTYSIIKENDKWFVGEKKYPVIESTVDTMISDIKSIRTLDKMGKKSNENLANRYEISDGKCVKVTAKLDGKVLRKVTIGKESSTGTQGYLTIDDGDEIYLSADNLRFSFDKSIADVRSKTVFQIDKNTINSVSTTDIYGNTWTVSRYGEGENLSWSVSGAEIDVDSTKATEWFNSLATLITTNWYEENAVLNGEKQNTLTINTGSENIVINVFKIPAETQDDKDVFYAKCNKTPYVFDIPSYSVQKFQKNPEDLAK